VSPVQFVPLRLGHCEWSMQQSTWNFRAPAHASSMWLLPAPVQPCLL